MHKKIFTLSVLVVTGMIAIVACNETPGRNSALTPVMDSTAMVTRGEYLVNAIGCDDCHSPKKMGPNGPEVVAETRFSGFPQNGQLPPVNINEVKKGFVLFAPDLTASVGPWGASYAANISSDATGIGNWPEENFIRAIRHGKIKGLDGGRSMLPPMPWTNFRKLTDNDLKSIFAYLKTTKPVENLVPAPKQLADLK